MSCSAPAPSAASHRRRAVYGVRRRRRRALLGATLILVLAATAFATARDPLQGSHRTPRARHVVRVSAVSWPQQGQAALALGNGHPAASAHQGPAPIASLAKLMTAYLTLER